MPRIRGVVLDLLSQLAHLETGHFRQYDVEDHDVGLLLAGEMQALLAIPCDGDLVPFPGGLEVTN